MPIQLYCRRHLGALAIIDSQGVIDVGRLAHHLRTCPICSRATVRAQKQAFGCLVTSSLPPPSVHLKYHLPSPAAGHFIADQGSPEYSPDLTKGRGSNLPQDPRSLVDDGIGPDPSLDFPAPYLNPPAINISLSLSNRISLFFSR